MSPSRMSAWRAMCRCRFCCRRLAHWSPPCPSNTPNMATLSKRLGLTSDTAREVKSTTHSTRSSWLLRTFWRLVWPTTTWIRELYSVALDAGSLAGKLTCRADRGGTADSWGRTSGCAAKVSIMALNSSPSRREALGGAPGVSPGRRSSP
eukprot:scaffold1435_cov267-Pinguiococcus_pyrenoidosus.AAC.40